MGLKGGGLLAVNDQIRTHSKSPHSSHLYLSAWREKSQQLLLAQKIEIFGRGPLILPKCSEYSLMHGAGQPMEKGQECVYFQGIPSIRRCDEESISYAKHFADKRHLGLSVTDMFDYRCTKGDRKLLVFEWQPSSFSSDERHTGDEVLDVGSILNAGRRDLFWMRVPLLKKIRVFKFGIWSHAHINDGVLGFRLHEVQKPAVKLPSSVT